MSRIIRQGNNAEPFWFRTDNRPDGFVSVEETLAGLPTPEEFRRALDGGDKNY